MADDIEVGIKATDKTAAGTSSAVSNIKKVDQAAAASTKAMAGLSTAGKAMGFVMGGFMATGAANLAMQIGQGTVELARMNVQVTRARSAFTVLSGGAENARAKLEAVKRASMGTVSELDAMQLANKAAALGMANTASELEKVVGTATKISMVMGGDVAGVLDNLSAAAANLSFVRLDTMGISANETKLKMAELLKTTKGLTQEQAFLQAAILVSQKTFDGINMDSAIDGATRLEVAWKDLQTRLAEGGAGRGANAFLNGVADGLKALEEDDKKYAKQLIADTNDRIAAMQEEVAASGELSQANAELISIMTQAGASSVDVAIKIAEMSQIDGEATAAKRELIASLVTERDAMMQAAGVTAHASQSVFQNIPTWVNFASALYTVADAAGAVSRAYAGIGAGPRNPNRAERGDAAVGGARSTGNGAIATALGNALAPDGGARQGLNQLAKAAKEGAGAMSAAAKASDDLRSTFEGAVRSIPGLFGVSSVTELDMKKAKAGLAVNYPDNYVRRAKDELLNGVDQADIDPAEVAKSVGLDLSVGADLIVAELERQWASGEYFVNPENLLKIDWEAYKVLMQQEANAALGSQNLIAEAMKQGITPESWQAATTGTGPLIVAGVQASLDDADMTPAAKAFGEKMRAAFADTSSDAYTSAYGAGESLATTINAGFANIVGTLNWGIPVTGGAPTGGETPPAKAIGTSYWTGGALRVHKDETIVLPRGSAVYTAAQSAQSGGNSSTVVVNANVPTPVSQRALVDMVLREIKRTQR
jgi:hypothetical protein